MDDNISDNCPHCGEHRETTCRCGWNPGLCINCAGEEHAPQSDYCDSCINAYMPIYDRLEEKEIDLMEDV